MQRVDETDAKKALLAKLRADLESRLELVVGEAMFKATVLQLIVTSCTWRNELEGETATGDSTGVDAAAAHTFFADAAACAFMRAHDFAVLRERDERVRAIEASDPSALAEREMVLLSEVAVSDGDRNAMLSHEFMSTKPQYDEYCAVSVNVQARLYAAEAARCARLIFESGSGAANGSAARPPTLASGLLRGLEARQRTLHAFALISTLVESHILENAGAAPPGLTMLELVAEAEVAVLRLSSKRNSFGVCQVRNVRTLWLIMLSKCPELWLIIRLPTVAVLAAIMQLFSSFVSTQNKERVQHLNVRGMNTRLTAADVVPALQDAALAWKMWTLRGVDAPVFDTTADYTSEFQAWYAETATNVHSKTSHTLAA